MVSKSGKQHDHEPEHEAVDPSRHRQTRHCAKSTSSLVKLHLDFVCKEITVLAIPSQLIKLDHFQYLVDVIHFEKLN